MNSLLGDPTATIQVAWFELVAEKKDEAIFPGLFGKTRYHPKVLQMYKNPNFNRTTLKYKSQRLKIKEAIAKTDKEAKSLQIKFNSILKCEP